MDPHLPPLLTVPLQSARILAYAVVLQMLHYKRTNILCVSLSAPFAHTIIKSHFIDEYVVKRRIRK